MFAKFTLTTREAPDAGLGTRTRRPWLRKVTKIAIPRACTHRPRVRGYRACSVCRGLIEEVREAPSISVNHKAGAVGQLSFRTVECLQWVESGHCAPSQDANYERLSQLGKSLSLIDQSSLHIWISARSARSRSPPASVQLAVQSRCRFARCHLLKGMPRVCRRVVKSTVPIPYFVKSRGTLKRWLD